MRIDRINILKFFIKKIYRQNISVHDRKRMVDVVIVTLTGGYKLYMMKVFSLFHL